MKEEVKEDSLLEAVIQLRVVRPKIESICLVFKLAI
jgi:hypothetical protein